METILAFFVIIAVAAFYIWVAWGYLSTLYHTVMFVFYSVAWFVCYVFEFLSGQHENQ